MKQFIDKLSTVLTLCNIPQCHTYNMDETGAPAVVKPHKIVAR